MPRGIWNGSAPGDRRPKLTRAAREALRQDIRDLLAEEPGLSKTEVGRRLASKYGVSGSTVTQLIRDMQ